MQEEVVLSCLHTKHRQENEGQMHVTCQTAQSLRKVDRSGRGLHGNTGGGVDGQQQQGRKDDLHLTTGTLRQGAVFHCAARFSYGLW